MNIRYKASFVREFKKLPADLRDEAKERIMQFRDPLNHQKLKVHKLKGKLRNYYSFSVTYSHRIVFDYESPEVVVFIAIGTHDIYR